jgi:hypothetical protein
MEVIMKILQLALVAGLLALGACTSTSRIFDNNCSGNGGMSSADYCMNDFKPHSGPWADR